MRTPHTRADLVARLDLPARVVLLTGASMFTLRPEPAIGLSELRVSDGPTGVRGLRFSGGPVVALLPNATLLSSSWDVDTAFEVGGLLAEEAQALRIHVVLGPTVNLHRTPRGGRLFEAFSDDPLLTGALAAASARGLQDQGVAAYLKHRVANESETARNTVDSQVERRRCARCTWLSVDIAVEAADPRTTTAAYDGVNGVAATEQRQVDSGIVKGDWGWDGLLMSGWFATRSAAASAEGGLDPVRDARPGRPVGRGAGASGHGGSGHGVVRRRPPAAAPPARGAGGGARGGALVSR